MVGVDLAALKFITQAKIQGQGGPQLPIVLHEKAVIVLTIPAIGIAKLLCIAGDGASQEVVHRGEGECAQGIRVVERVVFDMAQIEAGLDDVSSVDPTECVAPLIDVEDAPLGQ